ncbi:DUF4129 domain-containing protein [Specibacter cremeus]|uniref:DUF4129 domain-containing protein n=1 Tax=Specibacter cremeus TaxID=1629051 RepID=UPI0013DDCB25|nr:DUF4129 domain-containing protein [Specibacter cremeus]
MLPWPAAVPVTPDAGTARRWAVQELSRRVYQDAKPGVAQLVWDWIVRTLDDFLSGLAHLAASPALWLLLGLVVVLVTAAIVVVRPRLERRRAMAGSTVFDGGTVLSADAHRAAARTAEAAGDLATAVAELFRAMVRRAEERDLLAPAPGRTADEVAAALAGVFPDHRHPLAAAAGLFNAVRYGHGTPSPAEWTTLAGLDAALAAARPAPPLADPSDPSNLADPSDPGAPVASGGVRP